MPRVGILQATTDEYWLLWVFRGDSSWYWFPNRSLSGAMDQHQAPLASCEDLEKAADRFRTLKRTKQLASLVLLEDFAPRFSIKKNAFPLLVAKLVPNEAD